MHITWLGHSSFRLQDKLGTDGVSLVTDPFNPEKTGLKWSNLDADIVTISHQHEDHNYLKGVKGDAFVIDSAGEFEYKNIYVEGVDAFHDDEDGAKRGSNIIYRIEMDDLVITHLGDLGHNLDTKQLERIEGTHILFIPVGGIYTLDARKAVEVINEIEPRIVIPMHYKLPGLKYDLNELDKFIKEIGLVPHYEEKLKISKKDLPAEDTELLILSF